MVVTLNYRLGPLGFLTFGNNVVSGNMGLRDQQAALIWLQDHVSQYGGDPSRITVFGADAGAASVQALLLSPRPYGHLAGAISQSGGLLTGHLVTADQATAPDLSVGMARTFGCTEGQDTAMLQCLQEVNAEEMIWASLGR